jgi:DNA repair exonuclease SbcCD nuclease subunit
MLKIALASDVHLEFGDLNLTNDEGAEVLLLSGDIMIAEDLHDHPEPMNAIEQSMIANGQGMGRRQQAAQMYRDFLKRCSFQFPHVIYIAGNHEFYHGKWHRSLDTLHNECAKFSNVYFLEDQIKAIDGVSFIGCTLWTDMNRGDPLTLHAVRDMMNDYNQIVEDSLGYTKLRPAHTLNRHLKSMKYIKNVVAEKHDEKFVVVGHHAPSRMSTHPNYQNDTIMNGAYSSDLSEFILDHPQIKLWTHGHTHHPFDYTIGETRIVCNPRGYIGYEMEADDFKLKYLEV